MTKEFTLYEQALALKELGFNEPCFGYYLASTLFISNDIVYNSTDIPVIKAPLYQQAFRWFREKYKLSGIPTHQSYEIWNLETEECFIEVYPIQSYEEAELTCLIKLIKIVKNK